MNTQDITMARARLYNVHRDAATQPDGTIKVQRADIATAVHQMNAALQYIGVLERALHVATKTPHINAYLQINDLKALVQMEGALTWQD